VRTNQLPTAISGVKKSEGRAYATANPRGVINAKVTEGRRGRGAGEAEADAHHGNDAMIHDVLLVASRMANRDSRCTPCAIESLVRIGGCEQRRGGAQALLLSSVLLAATC
jgi:hypothetical protein